ncbi:MAG: hypothetical protein ACOC8P_00225 [Dichotomicrobium sp.]
MTETRVVEVPTPVLRKIPKERIEPMTVPVLPTDAKNKQLAETLGQCTDQLHRANLDRAWLRQRQTRSGERE